MTKYYIAIVIGMIQIFLSINLIIRRKNVIAILSEILTSLILLLALNGFSFDLSIISLRYIGVTVLEYFIVKVFLVIFMIIARIVSFNAIKKICQKKKKTNTKMLKLIRIFYQAKYWPKLKLGLPGMANKRATKTKVKFDSKGFPKFQSYYTVELRRKDFRKTREQHFYIANKELYKKTRSSARVKNRFTKNEIKLLEQGKTPSRYTWHHHQDAGVLQLVDFEVHSKTFHIGGYSIWGSK